MFKHGKCDLFFINLSEINAIHTWNFSQGKKNFSFLCREKSFFFIILCFFYQRIVINLSIMTNKDIIETKRSERNENIHIAAMHKYINDIIPWILYLLFIDTILSIAYNFSERYFSYRYITNKS